MRVFVFVLMVTASSACRYYCIDHLEREYCCDGGKDYNEPAEHDGVCPEVRGTCPRISNPPDVCPHDGACSPNSKCCYDICLEHHTCKPATLPVFTIAPPITPPTVKPPIIIANYARNKANQGK
ncbi:uncharacterized protein LOC122244506 [Penaeus japonicus]|uniref:uncharacterized protein LOC122244506 n=1 Tax=Penaeus japonicus TaxID=27405 RepID=UPI001C71266A|nr:uncharacterized protein LOC122244506 [Penaeus japonicus]